MARARIKFCGITNAECARAALAAGADALGFVLYAPAAVAVTVEEAAAIARALPPFAVTVALFVNPEAALVRRALDVMRPSVLQFHGEETAAFCEQFGAPYMKACRVRAAGDIEATMAAHPRAAAVLADAYTPDKRGGTGKTFDWESIPAAPARPLVAAGGLRPDNVGDLLRRARPYAVDVSSGVAQADDARRKNYAKMRDFVRSVIYADDNN